MEIFAPILFFVAAPLVLAACPPVDGSPDPDAGPGNNALDVTALCGPATDASFFGDDDPPGLTGVCDVLTPEQVVAFNVAKITRVIGIINFQPPDDQDVDFNFLENVDHLNIGPSPAMRICRFPALTTVLELNASDNSALGELSLPVLTTATDSITFTRNPHLSACAIDDIIAQLDEPPAEVANTENCDACCTP